jgi:outer membrane protein assembly factor BamA
MSTKHPEYQYLDLCQDVLDNGADKELFFNDVVLEREAGTLIIKVVERPTIAGINFAGTKKTKEIEEIKKEVDKARKEHISALEKVSELSKDEAKSKLIKNIEKDYEEDILKPMSGLHYAPKEDKKDGKSCTSCK